MHQAEPPQSSESELDQAEIDALVADERRRLLNEAGIGDVDRKAFSRPREHVFTRRERGSVKLLFGGLTLRHEKLLHAGFEGLGYKPEIVPTACKDDFQAGKEYGNNGQCNPTYFTVGALVNYLKKLRDQDGIPTSEILDNYVFLTAGACGPCRFGMYEAEYRLALRNAGFDGFRVLLFAQQGGLEQSDLEAGLEFNIDFFLTLLYAFMMGDLLNEVAYQIRPFETEPGATDRALDACIEHVSELFREKTYDEVQGGFFARLLHPFTPLDQRASVDKMLGHLRSDVYTAAMRECARIIREQVSVDFTRPKPIVKVTGEFWAQTTEGDGNFRMFPFLESQGAEVLVEPVTTWLCYMLSQSVAHLEDEQKAHAVHRIGLFARTREALDFRKKRFFMGLTQKLLNREYDRLRDALGGTTHAQVDQLELQRMGHPYYNTRAEGGEGHLEVAKNIYYCNNNLAHMVLSLKPFGCMPSTQSDGAQAAVISDFPDMIYLPIETSGEGDVNAHSRVQMALGEAKLKCRDEFQEAVRETGYDIEDIRAYVSQHAELSDPLLALPHDSTWIGKAAQYVTHVAHTMDSRSPASAAVSSSR